MARSGDITLRPPHTIRQQGTSRFVRPHTDMSIEEFDELTTGIATSGELTEREKAEALKHLSRISPHIHKKPFLGRLFERPQMKFDPNPTTGFFNKSALYRTRPEELQTFVSLDIETNDYNQPLSISALRFRYNAQKQQFESVDNFQRFYSTDWRQINRTYEVHGLSPRELRSLRKQQGAQYPKTYNASEMEAFKRFLGSSIVIGHNVASFDLPVLLHGASIPNSTIDTMFAARNVWRNQPNKLDNVFKRLFGKTMEEAGLPHHDANADTVATMMILQEMVKWEGVTGKSIQHVMQNPQGFHLAEIDNMLDEAEQIIKGTYLNAQGGRGAVRMTAQELGFKNGKGEWMGGMHLDNPVNSDKMSDAELVKDALREAKAWETETKSANLGSLGELSLLFNSFNFWKKSSLVQQMAKAKSEEEQVALLRAAGFTAEGTGGEVQHLKDLASNLRSARDRSAWNELEYTKERRIAHMYRHGQILNEKDDEKIIRAATSFDELNDAIDEVITKNQELVSVYEKFGRIKPYDINQLISAAKGQWGGITSAASGVVPRFILNPISRLGDAAFNAVDRSVSPWNAIQRTWNSGIGTAVTGGLTAMMGPAGAGIGMAMTGAINAGTQILGNRKQAQVEMAGLAIQNNLNVLGAMVSWIATPFQLLHRAAKTLIGSFSGLSLGINKFMQNSIGLMSQMGNPLEQLTGVGYSSYLGTTALDMATLNRGGTLNSTIEDFAKQSRALYGLGQVNNTRMIAASMLGVFDSVYTPTTDAAGAYYNTANRILRSMQGQSAEQQANTLYWATNLDSYMGGLIRSAMLLGESDVRNLTDPSKSGMYWRPLGEKEEARFRRTQYEFGSATQQFNFSKMRLGNKLWEAVGKDLYNGLNRLVDAAAGGNWKGVLEEAKNMWEMLKEKIKGAWESMTGGKDKVGFWGKLIDGFNKGSEAVVTWGAKIAKTIITVWDDIFLAVLEKAQGLISYLSTIHLGIKLGADGLSFELTSIKDAPNLDYNQRIFDTKTSNQGPYSAPRKGMEGLALLAKQLLPNLNPENSQGLYQNVTAQELMYLVGRKILSGESIDLPEYYLEGWNEKSADAARDLLESIYRADNWEYGDTKMASMGSSKYARKYITGETDYYQMAKTMLKDELEPIVDTIIDRSAEKLTIRLEISDASGAVKQSMDVNKGGVADSGFLTWLQDLLPDDLRLRVVTH